MILLDTNVVSEISRPKPDICVTDWYFAQPHSSLYLCTPVVMELAYGAYLYRLKTASNRYLDDLARLVEQAFAGRVISFGDDVSMVTGELRAQRKHAGRPISVQDAMIAATCRVHGAALATRNIKDFAGLDLRLINPFEGRDERA